MALWQLENAIRFGQCLNNLQQYKKWNQYLPSTCSLVNFSLTKEKRDQFIKMNLHAANCGHGCIFEIIQKQPKQSIMEIASSFWNELKTNRMNCAGCKTRICLFQISNTVIYLKLAYTYIWYHSLKMFVWNWRLRFSRPRRREFIYIFLFFEV